MDKHQKKYVISDLGICLSLPWEENVSEGFFPFVGNDSELSYQIFYEESESIQMPSGKKVFENQGFAVFLDENGKYIRSFHNAQRNYETYALMEMDFEKCTVSIKYLAAGIDNFGSSRKDFFHIGWERILIQEERMILHSACIDTFLGGILFSGPSGIGKSTQADLWCKYRKAKLLNGDKPIVRKTETGWKAYGSPYAGSSRCHVNESCGIRAIVMLKKAKYCSVRRLGIREAFCRIYEQVIVNSWDKSYVSKACDMVLELVNDIPVYELACTPDKSAVEFLGKTIGKDA